VCENTHRRSHIQLPGPGPACAQVPSLVPDVSASFRLPRTKALWSPASRPDREPGCGRARKTATLLNTLPCVSSGPLPAQGLSRPHVRNAREQLHGVAAGRRAALRKQHLRRPACVAASRGRRLSANPHVPRPSQTCDPVQTCAASRVQNLTCAHARAGFSECGRAGGGAYLDRKGTLLVVLSADGRLGVGSKGVHACGSASRRVDRVLCCLGTGLPVSRGNRRALGTDLKISYHIAFTPQFPFIPEIFDYFLQ